MDSDKKSRPSREFDEGEEAVSLKSNPPVGESPDMPERPPSPMDKESPSPAGSGPRTDSESKRASEFEPGATVGKYRIQKMIGRGGMATVYRALDTSGQRVVAVKVLKEKFSSSLKALARFDREFLALESLNHPNIVRVLGKGVEKGVNYFILEYVDGASFSRLLRHRKLTLNTRVQILLQVAAALECAHRKRIVHRDVKPDNVLINRTGRAKLADFGIAQITHSQLPLTSITVVSSFMGTADYMAPEQRTDAKSVDHRADIYSFGVMMYEALTGKLPLGNFPLPSQVNPQLGKRMDGIILRALRQDPDERYQSMTELAEDIKKETSASGLAKLKARLALMLETKSWQKFFNARAFGAVAVSAAIVIGLLWMFSAMGTPSPPPEVNPPPKVVFPPVGVVDPAPGGDQPKDPEVGGVLEPMALIPAGEFIMGADSEFSNERPRRSIYLKPYYIDKGEVTNAEYKKFADATGRRAPYVKAFWAAPFNWTDGTYPPGRGDYPVVLVSWSDAAAYAKWAGKRLPTEAEWEKAARGTDGRRWPWGNTWDPNKCNTEESFINSTQPAFSFPAGKSSYDCYNMAGNVTEWVADWYDERYYFRAPGRNPPGPPRTDTKVARGGAWDGNVHSYARAGYRHYFPPNTKRANIGFRCAMDVEKEK